MKYFLHDSNAFNDEKITELYIRFGYEGLGLFYTALEKFAAQEKPIKETVIKSQLKVGKKLEKCWKFMESIGLLSTNNGETFNEKLLNFSETYQIKKEKNKKRISEWRENQNNVENVTHSEHVRNAPKVKESKVKERKEGVCLVNPFSEEFLKDSWQGWKDYLKNERKKPIKVVPTENTALKKLFKLAAGDEKIAAEMLETSISSGWLSFIYAAPGQSNGNGRPQTENQRLNDIAKNGGHLKIDEKKWVQIRGKITQGEFELDGEGNLVMYCGRETLKVYPNDGFQSNVLYDLKPGNTIQEVHQYLLSERKLQIAS